MALEASVRTERYPLSVPFVISRGTRTHAEVVVVTLTDGAITAQGEGVPNARYGESVESASAEIEKILPLLQDGAGRAQIAKRMKHGAARNAVDCALWDLEAKRAGKTIAALAGLPPSKPVTTVYTLSLGTPEFMGEQAAAQAQRPILKLKLGGLGDVERVRAVRANAPNCILVADANEAWTPALFAEMIGPIKELGLAMLEQPMPAGKDEDLRTLPRLVPVCADESCHDRGDLKDLVGKYDMINIKLDKTGGLTEALALASDARDYGFGLMVGCMVGTSLSMAPTHLIAQLCKYTDIDAPLLLAQDRAHGMRYVGSIVEPPVSALWG
jgi:L-alanine-DL-glutamate epimerase-like enolase superfamily enzyme